MPALVECVPNFSEGRDPRIVEAIGAAALEGSDVWLLDRHLDPDHHRSVLTLVGTRESIGEAALRGIGKAAELIDLRKHQGVHPRIGAADVVPFVPVHSVTILDCVRIAERVAEECWRRFQIPAYLYGAAARSATRTNLENIRRGQIERLQEEVRTNPLKRPDFGDAELHPTAGATAVGARGFLIAFNINLKAADVSVANEIARAIRSSSGGLPCLKAMGIELRSRKIAQVSMNLTDFETTSIDAAFSAVEREAAARGVEIAASEFVGLVPKRALEGFDPARWKLNNFKPDGIFEARLQTVRREQSA